MDIKEHDVIQYENWGALYEAIVISVSGEALNVSVRSGPMTGKTSILMKSAVYSVNGKVIPKEGRNVIAGLP